MDEEIFRKKSLDRLKSPESLDECIKVTNPGIWLILAAVILLLVGACIWGAFGHIDSVTPVRIHSENGQLTAEVAEDDITSVKKGMTVHFAGVEATVEDMNREDDGCICTLSAKETVPNGFYDGNIVIQRFRPLSFIMN